jgi:FtsH-binding integral membrane protein
VGRKVPLNYILLLIFTFCEAYTVAFCCAAVGDPKIVIASAFMTSGIVIALTLYAVFTKTDFTTCGGVLTVACAVFILVGLFSFVLGATMRLVICGVGVLLFGVYLIFDT